MLPISDRPTAFLVTSIDQGSTLLFLISFEQGHTCLLLLLLQNIPISAKTATVSCSHSQISEEPSYCLQFQERELEGRTEINCKK